MDGEPDVTTTWNRVGCLGNSPEGKCAVCIYENDVSSSELDDYKTKKKYYKAVSFFKFDLPVVSVLLNFKISGTSKYILYE